MARYSPRVPVPGVHDLPLKLVEPGDVGPRDVAELPPGSDQDIRCGRKGLSRGEVGNLDLPAARQSRTRMSGNTSSPFLLDIIPLAVLDLVARLDEPRCPEPLGDVLEILLDLAPWRI